MADVSFATIWEGIAEALPDAVAVRTARGSLTYADLDARAARLASALHAAGIGPGSKVACYLYNGAPYLESVFAALKLGAVPVNVNYRYRGAELADLLRDADAEAVVFAGGLRDSVREAVGGGAADGEPAGGVPSLRLLVEVGAEVADPVAEREAGRLPVETVSYDDVLATHEPAPQAPRPGTDQLFMYTGGTTGRPKGVIWQLDELVDGLAFATYGALGEATPQTLDEAVGTAVRLHRQGRIRVSLPVVPLMHGTGLFNTIGTLLTAGEVVFPGGTSLDPARVWGAVQAHRVTNLLIAGNAVARPLVDALLEAEAAGRPYDLSSLTSMVSSGTTFTDDLKAALHRRSPVTIYDGLAASEGGPFAFAVTASERDLPSRFRPVPGTLVIDAEGRPIAPGEDRVGVLAFGGALPLGYHKDPERTASTYRLLDGRRHVVVGDFVAYLADGTLRFLGRGSGVINTGGEKVYPAEVEEALMTHPSVLDAVVIGEPDDTWGERVVAVVAAPSAPAAEAASAEELLGWLRPRLAGYKLPRRLAIVPELPRTPTGKLEVSRVRELLRSAPVGSQGVESGRAVP